MIKYFLFLVYPIILFISFFLIARKYKTTISKNIKYILNNSIIISILICAGLFIFFQFENTIYSYDYAGHWIRALEIKKYFINNPEVIFNKLYESMNYQDYSYLPALFIFPSLFVREGYSWFCICDYIYFFLPTIILLQIIYFDKTKLNKHLPIVISIIIYPLYLPIFYGKVDCCGMFFLLVCYALVIFPNLEETHIIDNLFTNLFMFLSMFLRRWYLYSVFCFYLIYFIKIIIYKGKEIKYYFQFILSFIFLLLITITLFNSFVINVLNSNFSEAYIFYNKNNKLFSFINYLSPMILLISLIGIYYQYKNNKYFLLANLLSIIAPCILVWKIQSFEFHHYYIFLLNILFLFISGLIQIYSINKYIAYISLVLLFCQSILLFTYIPNTFPIFTNIRKTPEILSNKNEIIDISEYIKSLETDDSISVFISGGAYGVISDDLLRNASLPNLDIPNIDSSVFDIRDGFPKDLRYIKYVITIDPPLYMDENYQHMYTIINNAIKNEPMFSTVYNKITTFKINDSYTATIYERIKDFTPQIKEYFYNKMISYYPDYKEKFKYILE